MKKYLFSLLAFVLLLPALGLAADVRNAEVITKEEKPKNLYLAGENPTVDGNVTGDLVSAGGTVTVNGNVQNDVLAAGGTLNLNGEVGGSVRVAGGTINVESNVGGDVVIFGGEVILGTKSKIAGDVIVFGGTVSLKGEVVGSVKNSYVGNVTVVGKVGGNVELNDVGKLKVDSTAVVAGDLKYSSPETGDISSSAKITGKTEYKKIQTKNVNGGSINFGSVLMGMLMAFITVLVFLRLLPKFAQKAVESALVDPWSKIGVGLLAMIGAPVAMLVLLITFFGWGVMGYLFLTYGVFMALTGTIGALFVGALSSRFLQKESELKLDWKSAGLGIVIVAILKVVPVIGWLGVFILSLLVFGTLTKMGFEYIKAQRA